MSLLLSLLLFLLAYYCYYYYYYYYYHRTTARPSSELAVNIRVSVGDGEPIESALRRFKREVNKSGHLMELRHRRTFENSQEKRKRKIKEGRMRAKFERMQRRRMNNRT